MSIRLSKYSKNLISETFSLYQKKEWKWDEILKIKGRCIIHLYPLKDTTCENKKGELQVDGLQDSLFFTAKICDCDNKIYYEKKFSDNLLIHDVYLDTRIFKDKSTMLTIDGGVKILYGQSLFISKID